MSGSYVFGAAATATSIGTSIQGGQLSINPTTQGGASLTVPGGGGRPALSIQEAPLSTLSLPPALSIQEAPLSTLSLPPALSIQEAPLSTLSLPPSLSILQAPLSTLSLPPKPPPSPAAPNPFAVASSGGGLVPSAAPAIAPAPPPTPIVSMAPAGQPVMLTTAPPPPAPAPVVNVFDTPGTVLFADPAETAAYAEQAQVAHQAALQTPEVQAMVAAAQGASRPPPGMTTYTPQGRAAPTTSIPIGPGPAGPVQTAAQAAAAPGGVGLGTLAIAAGAIGVFLYLRRRGKR